MTLGGGGGPARQVRRCRGRGGMPWASVGRVAVGERHARGGRAAGVPCAPPRACRARAAGERACRATRERAGERRAGGAPWAAEVRRASEARLRVVGERQGMRRAARELGTVRFRSGAGRRARATLGRCSGASHETLGRTPRGERTRRGSGRGTSGAHCRGVATGECRRGAPRPLQRACSRKGGLIEHRRLEAQQTREVSGGRSLVTSPVARVRAQARVARRGQRVGLCALRMARVARVARDVLARGWVHAHARRPGSPRPRSRAHMARGRAVLARACAARWGDHEDAPAGFVATSASAESRRVSVPAVSISEHGGAPDLPLCVAGAPHGQRLGATRSACCGELHRILLSRRGARCVHFGRGPCSRRARARCRATRPRDCTSTTCRGTTARC